MTPQQRKAIEILNRLLNESSLSKDDYFFLLDFIVDEKGVTYIPYYPQTEPFDIGKHVCVYACPTAPYDPNITISTTDTLNEEDKL